MIDRPVLERARCLTGRLPTSTIGGMRAPLFVLAALALPLGCSIDLVLGTESSGNGGGGANSSSSNSSGGTGGEGGASCGGPGQACCAGSTCGEPWLACDASNLCRGCVDRIVAGHSSNVACAETADGTTSCWGDNATLQLSCVSALSTSAPVPVAHLGDRTVGAVAAHACASDSESSAYCWGNNDKAQVGADPALSGTRVCPGVPLSFSAPIAELAVSKLGSFARLSNGELYGWGDNSLGQLALGGVSDTELHATPELLDWAPPSTDVAAANSATCVIGLDKKVTCAGSNSKRELGTTEVLPVGSARTLELTDVQRIHASRQGFCALDGDGEVWCWGSNESGLLGNTGPDAGTTRIVLPGPAKELAVGATHGCAILADDGVACWGFNGSGALGSCDQALGPGAHDVYLDSASQTKLRAKALALGGDFSCAIDLDDLVYCWGNNEVLQTGSAEGGDPICAPKRVPVSCD